MNLMLIVDDPKVAILAAESGIDRIFVDLEIEGKAERQVGLNAHLSTCSLVDVQTVRTAVPDATLVVRINPLTYRSRDEIDAVLDIGADMIMIPMFTNVEELRAAIEFVGGRASVIGLVETPQAFARLRQLLAAAPKPDEVYLGLNDLSLGLGLDYLFEPLAGGLVDHFCREAAHAGVPYGFGGVGVIGSTPIPAEMILSEHVRLASTSVILSRAFRNAALADIERDEGALLHEVRKIREVLESIRRSGSEQLEANRIRLSNIIDAVKNRQGNAV